MNSKSALKVIGTLLLLWGIFGYLFPNWHTTIFTNNENLWHVITGLVFIFMANFSPSYRRWTIFIGALLYLILGLYGLALKHPSDFHLKTITAQLDLFDNILHLIFALALSWNWLNKKNS